MQNTAIGFEVQVSVFSLFKVQSAKINGICLMTKPQRPYLDSWSIRKHIAAIRIKMIIL